MAMPYHAWADIVTFAHPSFAESACFSDASLPSADPTGAQPFRGTKNVSYYPEYGVQQANHEYPPDTDMAKKRLRPQNAALVPRSDLQDMTASHGGHGQLVQDFACNAAEHCHFSPPCDKADCDESTICFDHDAHDYLSCFHDAGALPCAVDECNFDFDCDLVPCPEACNEADCYQQQHAQGCIDAACTTVHCSDSQCSEGVLTCCMSDICPHKVPTDCRQPCAEDCQQFHTHCHAPLPRACYESCNANGQPSCPPPFADSISTSSISTPMTDLSDASQTPFSLPFQSLVEAATIQAFDSDNGWGPTLPFLNATYRSRNGKRRKMDTKSREQALYEEKVIHDTFSMKTEPGLQEWHDYAGFHFTPDFIYQPSHTDSIPAVMTQSRKQSNPSSKPTDSMSPDKSLLCMWQDETNGTCNTSFTSCDDFHAHVKEHTSTLVGNRGTNRNYKCRWLGCDKVDPFGTKNHLDRHMQNHTGFKPFKCTFDGCDHRCVTQQQLNNHLTTHTRSKPFVCGHLGCNKSFSVKTALSTHKRTHTNDKPFTCKFCGDKYADSSNLSKHRKTVHEEEKTSIPCPHPDCTYRDSRCQRLERHCRDNAHGAQVYMDPVRWAEYTAKWRKKGPATGGAGRTRTASIARSSVSVAA